MNATVCAVIVTFHPDRTALRSLVQALKPQVDRIAIVDNTPCGPISPSTPELADPRVTVLPQGRNVGVATALNIGIRFALAQGCTHVLLSDQDSEPTGCMVARLTSAAEALEATGIKVAVVGPSIFNQLTGASLKFLCAGRFPLLLDKKAFPVEAPAVEVISIITSGSLVSRDVLEKVGLMDEGMFIDFVDIEWCLRAAAAGFSSYAVPTAVLNHQMGDATRRYWFFGWRRLATYSPSRLFYQFRNSLYVFLQASTPAAYRIFLARFWVMKLFAHGVMLNGRLKSLHAMLSGWRAVCAGQMGPFDGGRP